MPYMIAVSLEMSDEPKIRLEPRLRYPAFSLLLFLRQNNIHDEQK